MATYNFTPKNIYDAEFDLKMRGYDKDQVNELLDQVIVDYETFQDEILSLKEETEFLKKKIYSFLVGRFFFKKGSIWRSISPRAFA